jgi:peptidoglycan-associated lipoprotein
MKKTLRSILMLTLAAGLAACSTPRAKKDQDGKTGAQGDTGPNASIPDVNVEEASLRGKDFQTIDALQTIRFDYDSAALKGPQLDTLKKNAAYLKSHPNVEVLVAGHCDERGTTEYNLALGQKRAKEVRDYYIRLGVSGRAVATISYGKESPTCSEPTEECWAANRRAETRVRAKAQ